MIFFHTYRPETWQAQIDAGFVRPGDGMRIMQNIDLPENEKFNPLFTPGSELSELLEHKFFGPFYIDRLQGGCYIENYIYDEKALAYALSFGERFYGFQMHEWFNNYLADLRKIKRSGTKDFSPAGIEAAIRSQYPNFPHLFLESMNAETMSSLGLPDTKEKVFGNTKTYYGAQMARTRGKLIPTDSNQLSFPIELAAGTEKFMVEIGAQTPDTRLQIAYARGISKASGRPFGTYYEPWGGDPLSAPCYQRDGKNEWNIKKEDFPYAAEGNNGGSSRSLQWRTYFYAWMSGSAWMSEEWGLCNTFRDWKTFEISPYGKVKLDFLRLCDRYPDIGEPVVPIAAVLPKDFLTFDLCPRGDHEYCGTLTEGEFDSLLTTVRKNLYSLFRASSPMVGTETRSLLNSTVPDAIDVVYDDCIIPRNYEYLVDLAEDGYLVKRFPEKVISVADVPRVLEDLLPVEVTGGCSKLLTKNQAGQYYLGLLNNSGVTRTMTDGEKLLPEAEITVTVKVKLPDRPLRFLEGNATVSRGADSLTVTVPAGGWFFGTF